MDYGFIHPFHLTIGLSVVRQSLEFLYTIQFTELGDHTTRESAALVTGMQELQRVRNTNV